MPFSLRPVCVGFLCLLPALLHAASPKPTPTPTPKVTPATVSTVPPVALPLSLDVVTFRTHADGEEHKLIATLSPTFLRVDCPDDRYSVIYDSKNDSYTGLEHSNYTYWQFAWAEVHDAIESSKRFESRLRDLNNENAASYRTPASTNASSSLSSPSLPDNSGYVWKSTLEKKRIAGLDCVRWTGNTPTGESVEAWCVQGPIPQVQEALDRLRVINEPMALVPVRTLIPPFVYVVSDALAKGGNFPVQINWGGDVKNQFTFVEARKRDGKPALFTVPNTYMKTTLATMDGIIDQKR